MSPEVLSERLLDFGVRVGKLVDALPDTRLGRHVGGQILRCGTSPAPNYEEGCAAESWADFVHKLSIVLKELHESRHWLRYLMKAKQLPDKRVQPLWKEGDELCRIIGQSLVTAKGVKHPKGGS
ncbi:MAG: four helix bundle protein [Gemmataceae bacterium]|nr:four helix bundle protein [Gemmataceae bacterium]